MRALFCLIVLLLAACGEAPRKDTESGSLSRSSVQLAPDTGWRYTDSIPTAYRMTDSLVTVVFTDSLPSRWRYTDSSYTAPPPPVDTIPTDTILPPPPDTVVTPPPSGGKHDFEPAGFTRLTERDFAQGLEDGWRWCNKGQARFSVVQMPSLRGSNATGAANFPGGWRAGTSPICIDRSFKAQETVYLDFDLGVSSNWVGHSASNKVLFVTGGSAAASPVVIRLVGGGQSALKLGIHLQGTPSDGVWTGTQTIVRGRMHRVVVAMTMNTCGQKNGTFTAWIDGVPALTLKALEYRGTRGKVPCNAGFTRVKFQPIWGGTAGTIPAAQAMYLGYLYVSGR